MITTNTNKKYVDQFKSKKNRFIEISKNASEQSFRNSLMIINDPIDFNDAINYEIDKKYIAHEKNDELLEVLDLKNFDVAFYVGPEGGFDQQEINDASNKGIKIISLGKRILRSETASIYLLSQIKD